MTAYPSESGCCQLIYLLPQTDLSLLPTSSQPPSLHPSIPLLHGLSVAARLWVGEDHPSSSTEPNGAYQHQYHGGKNIYVAAARLSDKSFLLAASSGGDYIIFWHSFFFFFQGGGATNVLSSVWLMHGCGCLEAPNILFCKAAEICDRVEGKIQIE